jgi:hypothetical protein
MCKLIQFKLCAEIDSDDAASPEDDLVRCLEWPQLLSSARQGGARARQVLQDHIACEFLISPLCRSREDLEIDGDADTHNHPLTRVHHVSTTLPGRTCVPDRTDSRLYQGLRAAETDV